MDSQLLERYFAGTCTGPERAAVEKWLPRDEALPAAGFPVDPDRQAMAWEAVSRRTGRQKPFPLVRLAAASLLLAIAAGVYFLFRTTPAPAVSWRKAANPGGRMMKISLPDGSRVQLNGGAVVEYPSAFTGNRRPVRMLAGEAFFDVEGRAAEPFIVETGEGTAVVVLGTRFNVRKTSTSGLAVTLTSGKIRFEAEGQPGSILSPGEQLVYSMQEKRVVHFGLVDTLAVAGWHRGMLVFNDTELKDVLDALERYYGVRFVAGKYAPQQVSAKFEGVRLETVLQVLGNATDLQFHRQGDSIYIRP